MPRVVVMDLPNHMASSLAIVTDVLATANAIQRRAGRAEPFAVHRLKVTRTTRFSFRGGDVVIVPGINAESASDLIRRLQSPPCSARFGLSGERMPQVRPSRPRAPARSSSPRRAC